MSTTVEYFIARHIPDVFRQETTNIGVIVRKGERVIAKFIGESSPNAFDGRKIRNFTYPDIYKQWVRYWRRLLRDSGIAALPDIVATSNNYSVIKGGEVSNTGKDDIEDVANYLYSLLVSEGGFKEALQDNELTEEDSESLVSAIASDFTQYNILSDWGSESLFARHPIYRGKSLSGKRLEHRPSFVQDNGVTVVIETVDFTKSKKELAKDHAGLIGFMFDDLSAENSNVSPCSIVKVRDEDRAHPAVVYGLGILNSASSQVINWLASNEKRRFLDDRIAIAKG
jgi:hypothetical protein